MYRSNNSQVVNENAITQLILGGTYDNFELSRPNEGEEYNNFEYDMCVRNKEGEVIGLIEAKYRSQPDRPTTDALISSLIKLLYEWAFTFNGGQDLKLILLIYLRKERSQVNNNFRNNLIDKLRKLFLYFCPNIDDTNFEIEIINIPVEVNENNTEIINVNELSQELENNVNILFNIAHQ